MTAKPATPVARKGAARLADVSPAVLRALEAGEIESATLVEGLAIDFSTLLANVFPDLAQAAQGCIDPKAGVTRRMAAASALIMQEKGIGSIRKLQDHPSDTVRGWAAYLIAAKPKQTLARRLSAIRRLADDAHFGVREWAWLALRPHVVAEPDLAIECLQAWTGSKSVNIRRFAVEAVRPRGVWCAHIAALKANPEPGLVLLDPLKSDPARYVQDSVANWLNDAAKTKPAWVAGVCEAWREQSATPATAYIVKRAMRSIKGDTT